MSGHRVHPIELQTIAFFISLLPVAAIFALVFAANVWEGRRRARKPALRGRNGGRLSTSAE